MVDRPAWTDIAANLFRDYNTIGNPGSGIYMPPKPDHRAYFLQMEGFFADLYDKAVTTLSGVGGTANAATAAGTPAVDALVVGQTYVYRPTATNTLADPTLNIDALGAKVLADSDGTGLPPGGAIANRDHLLFYDGTKLRVLGSRDPILYKVLDADDTGGQNVTTAQPWLPTAGGFTLPVGKYFFDGMLWTSRSAGAAAHGTSILFAGSATYTIDWVADVNIGDTAAIATATRVGAAVATAVAVKASSTSTTEQMLLSIRGRLDVTVAGTWIPQFQYTTSAPGGTPTVKRGSFVRLTQRPGGLASVGTFS